MRYRSNFCVYNDDVQGTAGITLAGMINAANRAAAAKAATRARRTAPAIVGFALGCALGAACEVVAGLWSLALPAGLALVALAIAVATKVHNPA